MRRSILVFVTFCLVGACNTEKQPSETLASTSAGAASPAANEPSPCSDCIPVTVENFVRAEPDLYFDNILKRLGASIGKFTFNRVPTLDQQDVIRMNRDTIYSAAVFDLDGAPVTISLPDAGKRFMSMQVINQDDIQVARM